MHSKTGFRKRVAASAAIAAMVVAASVGLSAPATALGTGSASCLNGGGIVGGTYQNSFSDAGGYTQRNGCVSNTISIRLRYQTYPGSGYYWGSNQHSTGNYVSRGQSGTVNGQHIAWNYSGPGYISQGGFST